MADELPFDPNATISVEQDGRILSGTGVTEESLQETMTARPEKVETPTEPAPVTPAAPTAQPPLTAGEDPADTLLERDPNTGQFKKPSRGQKRFAQLNAAREEQAYRAQQAEAERDQLRQRLAAYEAQQQQAQPQQPQAPPEEPNFERDYEAKVGVEYQTYGQAVQAFNRDYYQFQSGGIQSYIQQQFEAEQRSRSRQALIGSVVQRGMAAYPDFQQVIAQSQAAGVMLPDLEFILRQPDAEHIVYQLAQDPRLVQDLANSPLHEYGWKLARLSRPSQAPSQPASTPRVGASQAPSPYQPVGSGSKTTTPSADDLAQSGTDDYDTSGYREQRARERKGARR